MSPRGGFRNVAFRGVEQSRKRGLPGLIRSRSWRRRTAKYIVAYSGLRLRNELLATNGYLHAATACGYGCLTNLPNGAEGCTTAELKSNFLGTKRAGVIECEAKRAHGGCATQIWGATVANTGKTIALFRCVHMILYPR